MHVEFLFMNKNLENFDFVIFKRKKSIYHDCSTISTSIEMMMCIQVCVLCISFTWQPKRSDINTIIVLSNHILSTHTTPQNPMQLVPGRSPLNYHPSPLIISHKLKKDNTYNCAKYSHVTERHNTHSHHIVYEVLRYLWLIWCWLVLLQQCPQLQGVELETGGGDGGDVIRGRLHRDKISCRSLVTVFLPLSFF